MSEERETDERAACEAAWNKRYGATVSFEGFGKEYMLGWQDRAALARASEAAAGEPVAFRWRRRSRDKWEYETHATLSDADTVRVMLEDGCNAGNCLGCGESQPASEQQAARGLSDEQIEKAAIEFCKKPGMHGYVEPGDLIDFARVILAAKGDGHADDRTT